MTEVDDIAAATLGNKSFSVLQPGLQTSIDSTSLKEFSSCPRKYYYSIILGLQPKNESPHLRFGILLHKGREHYEVKKLAGASHEEALHFVVKWALMETWDRQLARPWISNHPEKNRLSLVRSLIWYLDQFGKEDPLETLILPNGSPAVEVSFSLDSGHKTSSTREEILLCGHLDRIATMSGANYICDIKTTGKSLGPGFFQSFSPDWQFSFYQYAGQIIVEKPISGIIVDGLQIGATFTRCERGPIPRPQAILDEWGAALPWWLRSMEISALSLNWPQNPQSCGNYGGCAFREACARPPAARELFLSANFVKRRWDPIERRVAGA